MNFNKEQLDAIESSAKHKLVLAGPGSGKTATLLGAVAHAAKKHSASRCVVITYTNAAAQELQDRWASELALDSDNHLGFVGTLHAFLLRCIREAFSNRFTVIDDEMKLSMLHVCARDLGVKASSSALLAAAAQDCMTANPTKLELVTLEYQLRLQYNNLLDFDTILRKGSEAVHVLLRNNEWHYRCLFVDEIQDAGQHDWCLYGTAPFEYKYLTGDTDQCQPATEKVLLSNGQYVSISEIKVGDSIYSYDRAGKDLINAATVSRVASRDYNGEIIEIAVKDKRARCTPSHKWLVKWCNRKNNKYATYLMRKGNYFRVGHTHLFRQENATERFALGIVGRLRGEEADAAWILKVHDTKEEALVYEAVTAAKYGLPEFCFIGMWKKKLTQEMINAIFSQVPNQEQRAELCLRDHNKYLNLPLVVKQERSRRTVMEVAACNIIPSIMAVPLLQDIKSNPQWVTIDSLSSFSYSGKVWSLDVRKHHKYITNSLVTCNSIYGFRGNRLDMLVKIAESASNPKAPEPKFELHLLESNYRNAEVICCAAQKLIEYNCCRYDKTTIPVFQQLQGIADSFAFETPAEELAWVSGYITRQAAQSREAGTLAPTTAVLARTNYIAESFATYLKAQGIAVATVEQAQRPHDWALAKLLLSTFANPWNDLLVAAALEAEGWNVAKLKLDAATQMISLNQCAGWHYGKGDIQLGIDVDLVRHKLSAESRERIHDAVRELSRLGEWNLNTLVLYLSQQDAMTRVVGEGVTCCTIHAAKGREFDTVFVVGCEEGTLPSNKDASDAKALEEARRLMFVAMTRAKTVLCLTWSKLRPSFANAQFTGPLEQRKRSRFLEEARL